MVQWGEKSAPDALPDVDFGGFWPTISGGKFRRLYRIPAELPNEIVIEQLRLAGLTVCRQLRRWRERQTAATMAEIAQDAVDGVGALTLYFERAVYCEAKAELLRETMRPTGARKPKTQ
ncbi:head completion/stabilization protein [Victivallis sp. Marseille-Q1083]|uniref:head completion/stabilization protein n=1 Tax=Victivallis sp. Marseille-Q1083 TaxID=2717288 RepID=UPI0015897589|nr:head completion/stabilization protein [Victivallis sp. Marseille-Q1083]